MSRVELVGYLASALVFATFYTKAMPALRLIAIASNIAFIVYGHLGGLAPIVLLHAGLLPLNAWRLCQMLRSRSKTPRDARSWSDHEVPPYQTGAATRTGQGEAQPRRVRPAGCRGRKPRV